MKYPSKSYNYRIHDFPILDELATWCGEMSAHYRDFRISVSCMQTQAYVNLWGLFILVL